MENKFTATVTERKKEGENLKIKIIHSSHEHLLVVTKDWNGYDIRLNNYKIGKIRWYTNTTKELIQGFSLGIFKNVRKFKFEIVENDKTYSSILKFRTKGSEISAIQIKINNEVVLNDVNF